LKGADFRHPGSVVRGAEGKLHEHKEDSLRTNYFSDCGDILLDLLCYELHRDRLSPETVSFLVDHIAGCPSCRRKATAFQEILAAEYSDFTIDMSLLCNS
jgi:hypothetical protein